MIVSRHLGDSARRMADRPPVGVGYRADVSAPPNWCSGALVASRRQGPGRWRALGDVLRHDDATDLALRRRSCDADEVWTPPGCHIHGDEVHACSHIAVGKETGVVDPPDECQPRGVAGVLDDSVEARERAESCVKDLGVAARTGGHQKPRAVRAPAPRADEFDSVKPLHSLVDQVDGGYPADLSVGRLMAQREVPSVRGELRSRPRLVVAEPVVDGKLGD